MRGVGVRCMQRNKRRFWFALYAGTEPIVDEYGNDTGEKNVLYDNPVEMYANISGGKGETQAEQFGNTDSYDKVIASDNTEPKFNVYSVLWADREPALSEDGSLLKDEKGEVITPHDYIVVGVAQSLNSVSYAVRKVNVR